jgi:hypothetical protein
MAVSVVVAALLAAAATASTPFSGHICGLLAASQPRAVLVTSRCVEQKRVTNSLGTIWSGAWGVIAGGDPYLGITVTKPPASQYTFGLAMAKARTPGGKPVGIGTWSSESGLTNGGTFDSVSFAQHGYLVLIEVNAKSRPLSSARVVALARSVAAKI